MIFYKNTVYPFNGSFYFFVKINIIFFAGLKRSIINIIIFFYQNFNLIILIIILHPGPGRTFQRFHRVPGDEKPKVRVFSRRKGFIGARTGAGTRDAAEPFASLRPENAIGDPGTLCVSPGTR